MYVLGGECTTCHTVPDFPQKGGPLNVEVWQMILSLNQSTGQGSLLTLSIVLCILFFCWSHVTREISTTECSVFSGVQSTYPDKLKCLKLPTFPRPVAQGFFFKNRSHCGLVYMKRMTVNYQCHQRHRPLNSLAQRICKSYPAKIFEY